MLLNLSNHPTTTWPKAQMDAAIEQFQSVQDLPFPNVDPVWSTEEVKILAEKYLQRIQQIVQKSNEPVAVHVVGEPTFTLAIVMLLQRAGFECYTSTTNRISQQDGDKKISIFKFVQFRAYPKVRLVSMG